MKVHLKNTQAQCNTKSMKCKKANQCYVHEGRKNLKKLRHLLQKIKPNHIGWKTGIKWNIEKGGFLETLFNFQYLREELLQTKREVNSFNENRLRLPDHTKRINLLLKIKSMKSHPEKIKIKKPGISKRIPKIKESKEIKFSSSTIERLRKKLWEKELKKDPYTDEEENEIFLKMYRNIEIRKYCEQSMIYFDTTLPSYMELSATLNSFREM